MRTFLRLFSIIALCSLICISILPFSFASQVNGVLYSNLPEPVPQDNVKYFVVSQSNGDKVPLLYMFSHNLGSSLNGSDFVVTLYPNANSVKFSITYTGSVFPFYVNMCIFDSLTGSYQGYMQIAMNSTFYDYDTSSLTGYDRFVSYGCNVNNSAHCRELNIQWNGKLQWDIYNLLSLSLNSIQSDLFNIDFNSEALLRDYRSYVSWVQNTFYPYFTTQTQNIISRLDQIISLLGGEYSSSEIEQPSEQQSNINELASAEDAIRGDVAGDIGNAFTDYGQVFTGNGAFALIKTGIESIILSNTKLNALIVFALTLGIAILLIGRRITV